MATEDQERTDQGSAQSESDGPIITDLIKKASEHRNMIPSRSGGVPSQETVTKTVTDILEEARIPVNRENISKAKCSIALHAQLGATSPKYAESRTESCFLPKISVKNIRTAAAKNKTTIRALARALKDTAIELALELEVEGNLSKAYLLDNPQAPREDLFWASDFLTFSENPSMPENVREWLLENYNRRFRQNK